MGLCAQDQREPRADRPEQNGCRVRLDSGCLWADALSIAGGPAAIALLAGVLSELVRIIRNAVVARIDRCYSSQKWSVADVAAWVRRGWHAIPGACAGPCALVYSQLRLPVARPCYRCSSFLALGSEGHNSVSLGSLRWHSTVCFRLARHVC